MPLNQFDNSYEALSIFINQQDEKEGRLDLKRYFKELYKKQRQQYIFWEKDRVSGTELFNYIYNEQKAFNIVLPAKQPEPLLICYYLPLKKLTGEWVEDFFQLPPIWRKSILFIIRRIITLCLLSAMSWETRSREKRQIP